MPEKFTKRKVPKVMFVNCGHGVTRRIEDCARLNYISAGQGDVEGRNPFFFSNQIRNLIEGDIIAVYRNRVGYVGLAKVVSEPMTITQAYLAGQVVSKEIFSRQANMFRNANNPGYSECLVEIKWLTPVYLGNAEGSGSCYGLFAKQHAVCNLDNQKTLRRCLQRDFRINFQDYLVNYTD